MPISTDPRDTITTESFGVAPELLGIPLARPWRRAFAIIADLIPVAFLSAAGLFPFLAFLAFFFVWRALGGRSGVIRRGAWTPIRFVVSLAAFVGVLEIGGTFERGPRVTQGEDPVNISVDASDSIPALVAALLSEFGIETPSSATEEESESLQGDQAVIVFAQALADGNDAEADRLRPAAEAALAGPRLRQVEERVRQLADENEDLRNTVAELAAEDGRRGGLMRWIASAADDLGIGFGWGALYFTVFTVLGRGQTPGKRLLGIRVIRLDARPVGWWLAFERFGSYFASFSTGMLGFAQIFWDRNRQALHDKAVETVVIRMPRHAHDIAERLNAARR